VKQGIVIISGWTEQAARDGGQDTSLVWREPAPEDVCRAVARGYWLAESCQRRLACDF
jgi:hypothetical protein